LDHGDFVADPVFGLAVPMAISGVPSEVLSPRKTWADSDEYDTAAAELAGMFRQNFEQFSDQVSDEVKAAGPH
jgi:phosphoenolpyruvate carboxykinase (ATP)